MAAVDESSRVAPRRVAGPGRRAHRPDARQRVAAGAGVAVGHVRPSGGAAPPRGPRPAPAVPARGAPAGALPLHGRGVPAQARRRGPGSDVRRRGRRLPHQPSVPPARRRPARDPSVDGVRLRHALRVRPRRAAGHLRQGRQLGRVDRHARRHGGALRRVRPVRPVDLGVDDDQRPRPDDPRHVPEHGHRPAPRARAGPRCCGGCGAPCRPTSSRRTRARTPASSPPSSASG